MPCFGNVQFKQPLVIWKIVIMRVAVTQFATSSNIQENLANCIRMINDAALCKPSLIVLPEFCNTQFHYSQACYVDHQQAWSEALAIDGDFLQEIAAQAKKHNCYISLGITLQRGHSSDSIASDETPAIKPNISVTSCVFSPDGVLIHQQDKQSLIGHENDFFAKENKVSKVVTLPFGKLGLLIGNDSNTYEVSRDLAIKGAQLLCNTTSTFALDQSSFHDPARASENSVFLASSNKIGTLVSDKELTKQSLVYSAQGQISPECFNGVGQSQIVSPEGKILAKIAHNKEGYVFADIDLSEAGITSNNKFRPDGSSFIEQHRPELYQNLKNNQASEHVQASDFDVNNKVPVTTNVAIFATYKSNEQAIEDVCHYIENNLSDIIQLPEFFFIADKSLTNDADYRNEIELLSQQVISQVSSVLRPFQYLCTSLLIEGKHQAVVINENGLLASQQQLHFCQRYQWTALGDEVNIITLPLEQGTITLAMLTADDAYIPEIVKVASSQGIQLLLVPFDIQEPCEVEYNLISRAYENRICIVAASREKSFTQSLSVEVVDDNPYNKNKVKAQKSTGLIVNLTTDSALLPQWRAQKFNGYINPPLLKHQFGKITKAVIHPIAACTKLDY